MNLRRTLSSCTVVVVSLGLGALAYSQSPSSAQQVPASAGPSNASSAGSAHLTSNASLAEEYAEIAALAAHPQAAQHTAPYAPVFRTAGGRPIRLYSSPGEDLATSAGTMAPGGDFAASGSPAVAAHSPLGASANPPGSYQGPSVPGKNDACSTPGDACSTNWSGLEEWTQSPSATFSGVSADWTVPTVTPTSASPEDTSTWVGIDGDPTFDDTDNPSLIQIGTDSPSDGESPSNVSYEAWYELLPGYELPLFPVSPGDQIEAVITETSPGTWEMAVDDVTADLAWSDSSISYDSPGFTAEFIQEATTLCISGSCGISTLQDFSTTTFTHLTYVNSGTVQSRTIFMVDEDNNPIDDPVVSGNSMTVTYGPPPLVGTSIPSGADAMAVDASNGDAYISSATNNSVTQVNTSSGATQSVTVDGAGGIVYDGTTGDMYVASTSGASPGIYEINPASFTASPTEIASVPQISSPIVSSTGSVAAGFVLADGALWTTSEAALGNLVDLVKVSNLTGTPATATFSGVLEPYLVGLVADPGAGDQDTLFDYAPAETPVSIGAIDLATTPPTVSIAPVSESGTGAQSQEIDNVNDMAVSPDGSTLVPAGGYPYEFVGLSTSTLDPSGLVYAAAPYPEAVAMTSGSGGLFAGAIGHGSATVFVYGVGAPADQLLDYTFSSPAYTVVPQGLAFSPDGANLYVITATSGGADTFEVLPVVSPPGPTAGEGTISGTVSGGGSPQSGVCVSADGVNGITAQYEAITDASGGYDFNDVVAGHYVVQFDPTCGDNQTSSYAIQFYGGPDRGSATPVTVSALQNVTGISAALATGASISGQVTDSDGPLAGACPLAYATDASYVNGTVDVTDSSGDYTILNLPADDYTVVFATCPLNGDAIQFYDNQNSFATANSFQVTAGEAVSGRDDDLAPGSPISGTVTEPGLGSGNYGGPCVYAYSSNFLTISDVQTQTNPDGSYELGSLPTGTYNVDFDPTCQGAYLSDYAPQWSNDQAAPGAAADVGDPSGGNPGVNATLVETAAAQEHPVEITTDALPSGELGEPYFTALDVTGGIPGWTWAIDNLPAGLQYSAGGVIFGTPTEPGPVTLELTATDGSSNPPLSDTVNLDLDITTGGTTTTAATTTTTRPTTTTTAATTTTTRATTTTTAATTTTTRATTTTTAATTTTTAATTTTTAGTGGGGGTPTAGPNPTTTTTAATTTTTGVTTTTAPTTTATAPLPIGSVTTTVGTTGATFSNHSGRAEATVSVPAGALPTGTRVNISPVVNSTALASEIPAGQAYVVAFSVSWTTPDGTSPAASEPITMTIVDPSIKAGDTIYLLAASGLRAVGVAVVNGRVTVTFSTDPEFVVAAVPRITSVGSAAAVVSASTIAVKLSCGPAVKCLGTGTLIAVAGKGAEPRTVTLAEGRFTIGAGKTRMVPLSETIQGKAFLKSHKDIPGLVKLTVTGGKKSTHQVRVP